MTPSHSRHDISDKTWRLLEPHLLGRQGAWGRVAKDNRLFTNAVFWVMRTGSLWRDCRLIWVTGATRIGVLSAGVIKAFGSRCWRW